VASAADQRANIIFGAVIDEALGDHIRVTVIATGFDQRPRDELARPTEVVEAEPREVGAQTTGAFEIPSEVLDVPSFLRDG
jgi:cell division protein FtsZ